MTPKHLCPAMLLLFLQVALVACQKDNDVEPIEQTIPLQVGNEWVYETTDYTNSGEVISTRLFSKSVVKDTVISNSTWYVLNDGLIVQNSSQGYIRFNGAGNEAIMIYQHNSYGGIGYMYEYPNYNLWVLTTRTYNLTPVANSAQNFSGYIFTIEQQYSQAGSSSSVSTIRKDYVSPGVGLVRSDKYYADSDNLMRREELISYRIF